MQCQFVHKTGFLLNCRLFIAPNNVQTDTASTHKDALQFYNLDALNSRRKSAILNVIRESNWSSPPRHGAGMKEIHGCKFKLLQNGPPRQSGWKIKVQHYLYP